MNDVQIYNNCVMSFVFLQNQSIIITFHTDKYWLRQTEQDMSSFSLWQCLFIVLLLILARNCIHRSFFEQTVNQSEPFVQTESCETKTISDQEFFLFGFHCNAALVFTGVSWRFPQVHSPVLKESFSFKAEKSRWKFVSLNYLKFRFLSPFLKNMVLFANRWPHTVGTPAEGPGGTRLRELKFPYEHRLHDKT